MVTVRQSVDIMGEFYERHNADPDWIAWFVANDIAIPLSWLAFRGLANPTDDAIPYITETWKSFCEVHEIDEYASFDNLDDFEDFAYSVK